MAPIRPGGPANEISFLSDLYNDKHTVVKRAVRSSLFYTQLHQALTQSRETLTTTRHFFFIDCCH